LLATQVISRLRRQFAVELPLRTLFANPAVDRLAHAIEDAVFASVGEQAVADALLAMKEGQ
jgi:hypothetical protein